MNNNTENNSVIAEKPFPLTLYDEYKNSSAFKDGITNSDISQTVIQSFDGLGIEKYEDFNSDTFWKQIAFCQAHYKDNPQRKDHSVKTVCSFYRWLVRKYSEFDFFAGSSSLTTELLMRPALVKNINLGAYFTTFSRTEDLGDKSLIYFIIRNFDRYSTCLKKVDGFVINTKVVETPVYRQLINKYVQNAASIAEATMGGYVNYVCEAVHLLERLKAEEGYPNPDPLNFTTAEAVLIRHFYENWPKKISLPTLNNRIGAVRRFFQWCKSSNLATFDDTFFDYFSQFEEPNKYHGHAIPDNDLTKISDCFLEQCKNDPKFLPYYAIFLIQLETEFRVSQICSLTVDTLQPSVKADQFLLYSNTKTSNGRKLYQPICLSTKKILETVIEQTETLRTEAVQTAYTNYIFLKAGKTGDVTPIRAEQFLHEFQATCDLAGVKRYTSRNLRDTHMTKAFEFILKNGKSDLQMGLLSKHSHIDTTKSHYIEMELTKMLESTYQVVLNNRDINQQRNVLDTLPDDYAGNDTVVENGCGHCTSAACTIIGSAPCLICPNFITTVNHKQYFIKMIARIDELLSKETIPHRIEDLTLIKRLYVNWLREIYLHEEETEC